MLPGQIKATPEQNKTIREVASTVKPPPINILYQDPKETIQLISQNNSQVNFHIKRLSKTKHVLQLNTLEDFQKAESVLSTAKASFYTYTPKGLKNHNFWLKGLPESFSEQEIMAELQSMVRENHGNTGSQFRNNEHSDESLSKYVNHRTSHSIMHTKPHKNSS
ncbi:hypothetical protein ANTRET_LOCUS5157 [Anthophora retusa]